MYYLKECILKSILLFSITLMVGSPLFGQTKTIEQSIPSQDISTVMVESGGVTRIRQMNLQEIELQSSLTTSGKVYGVKLGEAERPNFEFVTSRSNDTLFIKMPSEFNYASIGVNLYSESIQNQLLVPEDIRIFVQNAEQLIIADKINYLDIREAYKVEANNIHLENYSLVYCEPAIKLKVNGKSESSFIHKGEGEKVLMIKSDYINMNSK